jgi:hypothetical protein
MRGGNKCKHTIYPCLLLRGRKMAATIYEPLSTAHLKSCTVDFDSRPDKKAVNLVQYDQTIPVLCVSLKKGGTEYKVPSDADVNIRMDKRDGYYVYNPALGVNAERTIAYFAVTPQMSTGWGDYYPIVEITVGGGIAGSAPIWLHFDRNPLPENAIISSDEYKTIQQLLEDVTAVKAATEQIKAQTEAVRDQAKGFADNAKNSADKAQTLVDGMPSDYSQAIKDIGTLKNQMQRAYPDDSTIGENPWSSKNIVDMLCPPLEESGNPVVCYPVAGYPLGVKAKWEPVQEGSGTPSPENIRPIKGRNIVTVNLADGLRSWKMLTLNGTENWGTDTTDSPSKVGFKFQVPEIATPTMSHIKGDIVCNQYPTRTADETFARQNGISVEAQEHHYFRIYNDTYAGGTIDEWNAYLAAQYAAGTPVQVAYKLKKLFVVPDTNSVFFSEKPVQGGTGNPSPENIRPILLNNTVQVGQTNTLTLPETVYGGEVDAVSGVGESQYNKVNIRMENLNYNKSISAMLGYASSNILNGIQLPPSNRVAFDGVCDCLPTKPAYDINGGTIGLGVSASGDVYLRVEGLDSGEAYAAKFPDGVNVCYKVATPTSFSATGNASVKALSGVNTVLTDADSVTVTGRADPIKRITDLEDAVASQT